jgi:hypothetical protein
VTDLQQRERWFDACLVIFNTVQPALLEDEKYVPGTIGLAGDLPAMRLSGPRCLAPLGSAPLRGAGRRKTWIKLLWLCCHEIKFSPSSYIKLLGSRCLTYIDTEGWPFSKYAA